MKVGVVPLTPKDKTEDKVADWNVPIGNARGPYRRYGVNYAIDPAGLVFLRMADGNVHCDFELTIFVYTPAGELINSLQSQIHMNAPLEDVRKTVSTRGVFRHEEISTPAKGKYFLRIAVHDPHRDRYGAVEIATSQVQSVVSSGNTALQGK